MPMTRDERVALARTLLKELDDNKYGKIDAWGFTDFARAFPKVFASYSDVSNSSISEKLLPYVLELRRATREGDAVLVAKLETDGALTERERQSGEHLAHALSV